jgi:hypothetical protein
MKKQIKVTALCGKKTITSGWFKNITMGEEYADAMTARGFVVVKQYR